MGGIVARRDTNPVSIPVGFSDALQVQTHESLSLHFCVSIPVGFSDALQDTETDKPWRVKFHVSIPVGFSDALQDPAPGPIVLKDIVSIPVGFSDALQAEWGMGSIWTQCGFNPCRVFGCLASGPC